jgi:hypothetical protein
MWSGMNYDFAPFELAVKLKAKGFMEPCFGWYYPAEVCGFDYKTMIVFNNSAYRGSNYKDMLVSHKDEKHIDAPTIPQVLKWLRNTHNLHVETYPCVLGMWKFLVTNITTLEERALCDKYTSSEQAAIAGIEYVLDNLI